MTTTEIIALTTFMISSLHYFGGVAGSGRHASKIITSSPAACYFCLDAGSDYKQSPRKVHHDITKKIRKEMDDLVTKGLLHALLITVLT